MIIGRNLVEDQRLYSTGDDYVDELLERAFCEGYEYAQREFTSVRATKKALNNVLRGMRNNDAALVNRFSGATLKGNSSIFGGKAGNTKSRQTFEKMVSGKLPVETVTIKPKNIKKAAIVYNPGLSNQSKRLLDEF